MTQFISTDIIGSGEAINDGTTPGLVDGDGLYIAAGVNVVSTGDQAIRSGAIYDYTVTVAGHLIAEDEAILFRRTDSTAVMDFDVAVLASGTVYSETDYGINIFNDAADWATITGTISVNNAGSIGTNGRAALFLGAATTTDINNSGHIWTNADDDFFNNAIKVIGSDIVRITNTGLIETTAFDTSTSPNSIDDVAAISIDFAGVFSGSIARVVNSGTVTGASHSFFSNLETIQLINTGVMNGQVQTDGSTGSTFTLRNSGDINGDVISGNSTIDAMEDRVINSGVIDGDVVLNAGDDRLVNSGLITGDVDLGSGADVFRGFGGEVAGTVFGGAGDDTFFVDQADVVIDGGADYDTVYARADFVSGGNIEMIVLQGSDGIDATGADDANLIKGNTGDNDLLGLGGNDTIFGGAGDDFLDGGGGKDILRGDVGDDVLFGSLGADVMYGGAGSDTFLFTTQAESGIGTDRDQIRDFSRGEDVIDISELSDPAFTFEGTGALSGTGPSIAYFVNGNGHAIVEIDVDGDGVRDMQIAVFDNAVLTADDFIL